MSIELLLQVEEIAEFRGGIGNAKARVARANDCEAFLQKCTKGELALYLPHEIARIIFVTRIALSQQTPCNNDLLQD